MGTFARVRLAKEVYAAYRIAQDPKDWADRERWPHGHLPLRAWAAR